MTPDEALAGLAPALVIDLAQLSMSPESDLCITLQLMPFGDRAVLLAYGGIRYDKRRIVKIEPFLWDLMDAALARVCEWARATGFQVR